MRDPVGSLPGWRLVAFSDREWNTGVWEVIIDKDHGTARDAREKKVMFHKFFPKCRYAMWIDGSIRIETSFILEAAAHGSDILLSKHTNRDCVYQEASACMQLGKDRPRTIHAQIGKYFMEGYPPHAGMVETGVLFRRNTKQVRKLCNTWWKEICQHSHRDQVSFNYACWKTGTEYSTFPQSIRMDSRVEITAHIPRRLMASGIQVK